MALYNPGPQSILTRMLTNTVVCSDWQLMPRKSHFNFFIVLQHCICDINLSENEAENLSNDDVHLAQIPDFKMEYLKNHLAH